MWVTNRLMKTLQWTSLVLLLAVGLGSCGNKTKVNVPDPLLTEPQMVEVLSDVYVVEAILNQKKAQGQPCDSLTNTYYEQLFEHYGITDSILDANMDYYAHYPEILERIMDSVVNRLEQAKQ